MSPVSWQTPRPERVTIWSAGRKLVKLVIGFWLAGAAVYFLAFVIDYLRGAL